MFDHEISELLAQLNIVERLYEIARIVDPIEKKVISYRSKEVVKSDVLCFDFWERNTYCNNCISIRAYNEGKAFFKVEYIHEKIYMITAIPVQLESGLVVVELLKDATSSMIFSDNEDGVHVELYKIIDTINEIALKDSLTEVYNRRYINERLPMDVLTAALSKGSIAIVMADIDFFKKVNDEHGHLIGDGVLKAVATRLTGAVRGDDWVARYGGEEFLICLPGADEASAHAIAERMRVLIQEPILLAGGRHLNITASFGVCAVMPAAETTAEQLIEKADDMLYKAKQNGRNRVEK